MPETFICPRCGAESANPDDVRTGYCGLCHDFTGGFPSRLAFEEWLATGEIPEWRKRVLADMAVREAVREAIGDS